MITATFLFFVNLTIGAVFFLFVSELIKKVVEQTGGNYDEALIFLSNNNWDIGKLRTVNAKPLPKFQNVNKPYDPTK